MYQQVNVMHIIFQTIYSYCGVPFEQVHAFMMWCIFVPLRHLFNTHVAKPTQMGINVSTINCARSKKQRKLVWILSMCISQCLTSFQTHNFDFMQS